MKKSIFSFFVKFAAFWANFSTQNPGKSIKGPKD